MGQHTGSLPDQIGPQLAHSPIRRDIFGMDGLGLSQQTGDRRRARHRCSNDGAHLVKRPEQIHRRGTGCGKDLQVRRYRLLPVIGTLRKSGPRREYHAIRRRDADRRGAANLHGGNGFGHTRGRRMAMVVAGVRKPPLVQDQQALIGPTQRAHGVLDYLVGRIRRHGKYEPGNEMTNFSVSARVCSPESRSSDR